MVDELHQIILCRKDVIEYLFPVSAVTFEKTDLSGKDALF